MNKKEFISAVAAETGDSISQTEMLVDAATDIITQSLLEGKSVLLQNLGTFEVKEKKERLSVNPRTGVRTLTPPKLQVNFKPALSLKGEVKKDDNNPRPTEATD